MALATMADVLKLGIDREVESQRLYADLASSLSLASAKYACLLLVDEERKHQEILEEYLGAGLGQGAIDTRQRIDFKIAEQFGRPELRADMRLPELLLLAADRERESVDFYASLAALHAPGTVRSLLERLATEESGHKQKVEKMYAEVAFPQTDGG